MSTTSKLSQALQILSEVHKIDYGSYSSKVCQIWISTSKDNLQEAMQSYLGQWHPAGYGTRFTEIRTVDHRLSSDLRSLHAGKFYTIVSRWTSCD